MKSGGDVAGGVMVGGRRTMVVVSFEQKNPFLEGVQKLSDWRKGGTNLWSRNM